MGAATATSAGRMKKHWGGLRVLGVDQVGYRVGPRDDDRK